MTLNVITPLGRPERYSEMGAMLFNQGIKNWILLLDDHQKLVLPDFDGRAHFQTYARSPWGSPGVVLCNMAMRQYPFADNEWYLWLCDDDWLPEDFVIRVKKAEAKDLIICSMLRGHHSTSNHPCWPLIAKPGPLGYGGIGFEQGIMRGGMIKHYRKHQAIDSLELNEKHLIAMVALYQTVYLPEVAVYFNWIEPGRWDK